MTDNNSSRYFSSITVGSLSMRTGGAKVELKFTGPIQIGIRAGTTPATSGTLPQTGIYIGNGAAYALVPTSGWNIVIGHSAGNVSGSQITSGSNMTILGSYVYSIDGTADQAVAVGAGASIAAYGTSIGTGARSSNYSVSVGIGAGDIDNGGNNVAIGRSALAASSAAIANCVAIGTYALGVGVKTNTNANGCVAVGHEALRAFTTGTATAAFGYRAGYSTTTGQRNTFIGDEAGISNVGGSDNTIVGNYARGGAATTGSTIIGAQVNNTADNTITFGCNGGSRTISTAVNRSVNGTSIGIPANVDYMDWIVNGVAYKLPLYT